MNPESLFHQFINKFIPLTQEEFDQLIKPYIAVRHFKKKQTITEAGEVERYLYYITHGLVRKYFKKDDEELITQIAREGQIIHSQGSFHRQKPSPYVVEAIELTTVVAVEYDDLQKLFSANAKMEKLGRLFVTDILVLNDRWQMMLLKMTPRERFLDFVQRNSELVQRTPQKYLASLLNIQPETFSRFKHLLSEGQDTENPQTQYPQNP